MQKTICPTNTRRSRHASAGQSHISSSLWLGEGGGVVEEVEACCLLVSSTSTSCIGQTQRQIPATVGTWLSRRPEHWFINRANRNKTNRYMKEVEEGSNQNLSKGCPFIKGVYLYIAKIAFGPPPRAPPHIWTQTVRWALFCHKPPWQKFWPYENAVETKGI